MKCYADDAHARVQKNLSLSKTDRLSGAPVDPSTDWLGDAAEAFLDAGETKPFARPLGDERRPGGCE